MGVTLVDLTDEEFVARRPAMVAGFAASVSTNFDIPFDQAEAEADRQLRAGLPDGVRTKGQLLRWAVDDGAEVGFLWISLPGTTYPEMAWLSEIEVSAAHRGRGHGTRMIAAAEAELRSLGVSRIGLHVFGDNEGARRLYARLGYRILSQVRAHPIVPGPAPSIALAPMSQPEYERRLAGLVAHDPFALTRDPAAGTDGARRVAERIAPLGVRSTGVFLRTAHADGRPVGWVWFGLPNAERPSTGLVIYLEIAPALRRKGLGRAVLASAEAELSRHGVARAGLSVPGEANALAFADALGLPLVSQQMIKDL